MPFQSPFLQSLPSGGELTIQGHQGEEKHYHFPTFFVGTRATTVITTGSTSVARELLGDTADSLHPVQVRPGRCLIGIIAFHYGQITDGMKSYHEFAIGIAVSPAKLPLLPAIARERYGFGLWVQHLPVDSEENCHRGNVIWGLPKVMRRFSDEETDSVRTAEVWEGEKRGLRCEFPIDGPYRPFTEENRVYSKKDGKLWVTRTLQSGHRTTRFGRKFSLEIGDTAEGQTLQRLDPSTRALMIRHSKDMESALYLPKELTARE